MPKDWAKMTPHPRHEDQPKSDMSKGNPKTDYRVAKPYPGANAGKPSATSNSTRGSK